MNIRLYFALGIFLLGLFIAGQSLWNGQPLIALSSFFIGIYCALGVLLGFGDVISNPMFRAAAAVILAIGLLGVFLYSRAFDTELQDAHRAVFASLVNMEARLYCNPMPIELQEITAFGLQACAMQENADQLSATVDLAKGIYFGPTLSLADSAYSSTAEPAKDNCALAFKAAFADCPKAFHSLSGSHKAVLLKGLK